MCSHYELVVNTYVQDLPHQMSSPWLLPTSAHMTLFVCVLRVTLIGGLHRRKKCVYLRSVLNVVAVAEVSDLALFC